MIPALRDELSRFQTIPFARFMELALYAPGEGYYERDLNAIGPQGDFYTSVTASPLFAELLALEMANWLGQLPAGPCHLVEAGAHNGALASGILRCLASAFPTLAAQVTYVILEPSPRRREWQKKMLEDFAGVVCWAAGWEEVSQSGVRGVVFSNELLDAMPLRRVGWDASVRTWFEWGVSLQGQQLGWERLPLTRDDCAALFLDAALECPSALEKVLPDGFTLDLSPAAAQWWEKAARHLQAGWLLSFDYGLISEEFWAPSRAKGTLRSYTKHHLSTEVLADPGQQDLTAHVNFSALQRAGERAGLRTIGLFYQEQFLGSLARATMIHRADWWTSERRAQLQPLIHPEHLGRPFRVLVQQKP